MEVEGSFDNWGVRHTMQKSGKDFTIIKLLPPGVYQVGHCTCASGPCLLLLQGPFAKQENNPV